MDSSLNPARQRVLSGVLGLVLAIFAAYLPALWAGFIWDDDHHLTANLLLSEPGGLKKIWTTPGGFYYPLVLTTFWVIRHIWDLAPWPYHLLNISLHSVNALLLWGLLARFSMPGAWFAAALFALHPVQVESVAWVTELKNIQSGFFYLLSFHALLQVWPPNEVAANSQPQKGDGGSFMDSRLRGNNDVDESLRRTSSPRKRESTASARGRLSLAGWYAAGLATFALAVLSKPSTVMFPVVLLGYLIWRRRGLEIRDFLFPLPFFALSAAASVWTIWEQKFHSMAQGGEWSAPFVERILNAPHIIGFYLLKLAWPQPLMFIYPKWEIDPGQALAYLPALLLVAVSALLYIKRGSWSEGPPLALAYFIITLFPVLGFFNIYFMAYSWVADHFQYLASIGPLTLAGYLVARISAFSHAREGGVVPQVAGGLILLALSICTWRQALVYHDEETLWKDAITKNPKAAMAFNNLGSFLSNQGRMGEAIPYFERALELHPDDGEYHYNLALALGRGGNVEKSSLHFQKAIDLKPMEHQAYTSYASLLSAVGRDTEAIALYEKALEIAPETSDAHGTRLLLAGLFMKTGNKERALHHYEEAVRTHPEAFDAHVGLGVLLEGMGRREDSQRQYEAALQIHPDERISGRLKRLREGTPANPQMEGP